jgi:hypothetical protein
MFPFLTCLFLTKKISRWSNLMLILQKESLSPSFLPVDVTRRVGTKRPLSRLLGSLTDARVFRLSAFSHSFLGRPCLRKDSPQWRSKPLVRPTTIQLKAL